MKFKIQKPILPTKEPQFYLTSNKNESIVFSDIEIGQFPQLDNMFNNTNEIYIEGYIDKKERLIIKRKIENENW